MTRQRADLNWKDGNVPVSDRFDDPYFSLRDGLAETRHVFLGGNDLPGRFAPGFQVAELGFGTGLNFLATWAAWEQAQQGGVLTFTSFEAYPMRPGDMKQALSAFPELAAKTNRFLASWEGEGRCDLGNVHLNVIPGDARQTLPHWTGRANAWYLDGFSPAKNPELWENALLAQVARHTAPNGTAATYSAAGHIRRGLQDAGFRVTRIPGYGRKRHMTQAALA